MQTRPLLPPWLRVFAARVVSGLDPKGNPQIKEAAKRVEKGKGHPNDIWLLQETIKKQSGEIANIARAALDKAGISY